MMTFFRRRQISMSIFRATYRKQKVSALSTFRRQETLDDFSSVDQNFERDRLQKVEGELKPRDRITYFYLGAPRIVYASLARLTLIKVRHLLRLFDNALMSILCSKVRCKYERNS
jgi:hypothetical protein